MDRQDNTSESSREGPGEAGTGELSRMADPMVVLKELQHWTLVMGRAQQMLMEAWSKELKKDGAPLPGLKPPGAGEPMAMMQAGAEAWLKGLQAWGKLFDSVEKAKESKDRRFAAPEWRDNPLFDTIRQSYLAISDRLLGTVEDLPGIDEETRAKLRFATRSFVEAASPTNFALTNPEVIHRTIEQRGENLLKGLANMLRDLERGQITQTRPGYFEVGRNLATTPGKVVHETELYQLIQYSPTTEAVLKTPLVIFPPWINRFYILDLTPDKSFVRWAVDQGVTLYMVSWKSADESLAHVTLEDYVLRGQIDAIDTVRDMLGVDGVHTIGYCVAGTVLAVTLAYLAARGEADKIKSATFLTAQVDFTEGGELRLFVGDEFAAMLDQLTKDSGYLDGRYMGATFNLLRGRDLIWSYVVNNYLLGEEPPPFDMLHWNSDTTNLPSGWLKHYLENFYRANKLVTPGGITVDDTPIDISKIAVPAYIQAGREDHIAPAESVWKTMNHLSGPKRFVLAGSGHIAGVINPPSSGKYQYWVNQGSPTTLEEFIAGATEHKGSWWPDWIEWLRGIDPATVEAKGARIPGKGKYKAIEDAPGRYVRMR